MIFRVIHIHTGYRNRPNWLLAGYSVYHRVASLASQPTMFMTGPRSRHQRRCVRDHNVYDRPAISAPATARAGRNRFLYECMMIHSRIESPSVLVQGMHMKVLVRYIVTGCIFCAPSGLRQGQVFDPPSK